MTLEKKCFNSNTRHKVLKGGNVKKIKSEYAIKIFFPGHFMRGLKSVHFDNTVERIIHSGRIKINPILQEIDK